MKPHFLTLPLILSIIMLASCDSNNTKENLQHAEFAIERQDYNSARGICDNIRKQQNDAEKMDASTLCNLSMLYMKLGETDDREDNIGLARQCYIDAYATDSAEAHNYYDNVSVEDLPHLSLLTSIVRSTTGSPAGITDDCINESDSISGIN